MLKTALFHIGEYVLLMKRVFKKPEKISVFFKTLVDEMHAQGIGSLFLIMVVSLAMGGVTTIQTALQIENPLIPSWTLGFTVRQAVITELAPTIMSLILAAKIGSRIASELGTMQITEQVDALEVMGINSANYLILPKVIASLIVNPMLIFISICLCLIGGYFTVLTSISVVSTHEYLDGLTAYFKIYDLVYVYIKTVVFAFIIISISSYFGYQTRGTTLDVGKSSTNALVYSSLVMLLFDFIITQIMF
jgi:phospholipid/cholesterol/gamma-HCH transport system permease protein